MKDEHVFFFPFLIQSYHLMENSYILRVCRRVDSAGVKGGDYFLEQLQHFIDGIQSLRSINDV